MTDSKTGSSMEIIKSIMAGVMIAIGATVYLSVDNKIIGAFLFSVGLLTIVIYGLNLFTGKAGYLKEVGIFRLMVFFIGNFAGTTITMCAVMFTRPDLREKMVELSMKKINSSAFALIILGIMCGILMYVAVEGYKRTKCQNTPTFAGVVIVVLPVATFILCGFEHSIADMCYLTPILFTNTLSYLKTIGLVAIGNLIGALLIAKTTAI